MDVRARCAIWAVRFMGVVGKQIARADLSAIQMFAAVGVKDLIGLLALSLYGAVGSRSVSEILLPEASLFHPLGLCEGNCQSMTLARRPGQVSWALQAAAFRRSGGSTPSGKASAGCAWRKSVSIPPRPSPVRAAEISETLALP